MKKINEKVVSNVAFGIGVILGVVVVFTVYKNIHILKEARWTPQGDMLLTFYHRKNAYLIPKPE